MLGRVIHSCHPGFRKLRSLEAIVSLDLYILSKSTKVQPLDEL